MVRMKAEQLRALPVLVADADPDAGATVAWILTHAGAQASLCADAPTAVAELAAGIWGLLVVSGRLPGAGDAGGAAALRRIPVLWLVGPGASARADAYTRGADVALTVPLMPEELVAAAAALARRGGERNA